MSGVTLTHVCGYCGARHTAEAVASKPVNSQRPAGWSVNSTKAPEPEWFYDDEPEPPPRPRAFCSDDHRTAWIRGREEIEHAAYKEGQALACQLYRDRLAAFMLEAKGAVRALGDVADGTD